MGFCGDIETVSVPELFGWVGSGKKSGMDPSKVKLPGVPVSHESTLNVPAPSVSSA